MKKFLILTCVAATSLTVNAFAQNFAAPAAPTAPSIIPKPVSMKVKSGAPFILNAQTKILLASRDKKLIDIASYLVTVLKDSTGSARGASVSVQPMKNSIFLKIDPSLGANDEAYKLESDANGVQITGKTAHGVFNGVQTLLQLLPPQIISKTAVSGEKWTIPSVAISDQPRFHWRGLMLDCGRYFHSKEDIEKLLDVMAMLKLNVFHWHLTEDQGWRLAIKQYPKLTSISSWRSGSPEHGNRNKVDHVRYGGFYTQQDAKEIVAYAAERFITVVPEIEIPGHSAAALTAYPQFGNTDIAGYHPEVRTKWGVSDYTYSPKPETFQFLKNILTEVLAIFPGKYIHIGGDEAPTTQWDHSKYAQNFMKQHGLKNGHQLQSYFTAQMAEFLKQHGRKLIGWDEIEKGGLPQNSAVMVWHGFNYAMTAIKAGHDVVIGNTSNLYFDYAQAKSTPEHKEPETIGGMITLKSVYDFNPMPPQATTPEQQKHVLGVQAQLWSEYLWDWKKVEYNAFPRFCALAEIAWTPNNEKNYSDFLAHLKPFLKRLDILHINYRPLDAQTPNKP